MFQEGKRAVSQFNQQLRRSEIVEVGFKVSLILYASVRFFEEADKRHEAKIVLQDDVQTLHEQIYSFLLPLLRLHTHKNVFACLFLACILQTVYLRGEIQDLLVVDNVLLV